MPIEVEGEKLEGYDDLEGITFANVDMSNLELVERVSERDNALAGIRIGKAVKRLQDLGIIDAEGRLINPELPPDMREGSDTDFGG